MPKQTGTIFRDFDSDPPKPIAHFKLLGQRHALVARMDLPTQVLDAIESHDEDVQGLSPIDTDRRQAALIRLIVPSLPEDFRDRTTIHSRLELIRWFSQVWAGESAGNGADPLARAPRSKGRKPAVSSGPPSNVGSSSRPGIGGETL